MKCCCFQVLLAPNGCWTNGFDVGGNCEGNDCEGNILVCCWTGNLGGIFVDWSELWGRVEKGVPPNKLLFNPDDEVWWPNSVKWIKKS